MSADVEALLAQAESQLDGRARELHRALAASLVELFGEGLARVLALAPPELVRALADDEKVAPLLALCGRHPDPPADRARRALEDAAAALGSVGVRLVSLTSEEPRLRVELQAERGEVVVEDRVRGLVEAIVAARAPEIDWIDLVITGVTSSFVPLERLRVAR